MKQISFAKINPQENMTIIVTETCEKTEYPLIANQLMKIDSLCAEQVGFLARKHKEAYSTYIFDARVDGYGKVIAGGGCFKVAPNDCSLFHCGAGIGITRLTDFLLE